MKKLLLTLTTLSLFAVANDNIEYPDGYRSWTHLKTSITKQNEIKEFIGISHIYANDKAMVGLKLNSYEKGAIFILDHLDMNISKASINEGKRFFTGVMIYNPQKFGRTGNWGFESFIGDSKTNRGVKNSINECFNCHTQVKNKSYVFSSFRK